MKKIAFISSCVGLLFISACSNTESKTAEQDTYPVTTIIKVDTFTYSDYVTEIHALQNVEVRARVKGYLEKVHCDEGAHVKTNQLLFSINNREYAEELSKAKALCKQAVTDVNAAGLELKNTLQLAEKKIVSATEVELAQNKLEAQKAKLEEAQANQSSAQLRLSNTEVRAPFDGVINRIPSKIGSLIDEGTLLTTISEYHQLFAYFDVSEKEYLNYARNLKTDSAESKIVSLILADGTEHSQKGMIETVEGVIDANTGNIAFRARFDNPDKLIKHGASGKIRLRKKFKGAIVVPQKSTFELQDKLYVYVIDSTNTVKLRQIETSYRLPHLFIVSQGLKAGERVLFEGIQTVKADSRIQVKETPMLSIIKKLASK